MTEKLALLGGKPLRSETIPSYNTIGEKEVLKFWQKELSGFVAATENFWGGEYVKKLENT